MILCRLQTLIKSSPVLNAPTNLLFTDIAMPVMDGFEATRAIRDLESRRQTPSPALIVAVTSLALGGEKAEAFASGVDIFMTKPVSFEEVGKLLESWEKDGEGSLRSGAARGVIV